LESQERKRHKIIETLKHDKKAYKTKIIEHSLSEADKHKAQIIIEYLESTIKILEWIDARSKNNRSVG